MPANHSDATPKADPENITAPGAPPTDTESKSSTDQKKQKLVYTVTVALKLKKRHHLRLQRILNTCRLVYNAANEERHGVRTRFLRHEWVPASKRKAAGLKRVPRREPNRSNYSQQKQLTTIRAADPEVRNLSVAVVRGALSALAAAWKNVGKPIPNTDGRTVQPPRYKARHRDNVIIWDDPRDVQIQRKLPN